MTFIILVNNTDRTSAKNNRVAHLPMTDVDVISDKKTYFEVNMPYIAATKFNESLGTGRTDGFWCVQYVKHISIYG